jgi:hypothetical protein
MNICVSWKQVKIFASWVYFPASGFCKHCDESSRKPKLTAVGICCADHMTPSIRKNWHFADKRRSLGRLV